MGWFRKKPSVQEQRLALGLIAGNPAPIHRYGPVFLDAINGAAMHREPSEIADDMGIGYSATPAQEAILLNTVSNEFVALTTRIDRLREMYPDVSQLLELHEALLCYLTAFSTAAELWNGGLRAELHGNASEAARLFAASDRRTS